MAEVALTAVSVGRVTDEGFERVELIAGDKLPAWVSQEDKKALRENGALGEPIPTAEEVADKDAEIARLKALLAEASKTETKATK